MATPNQSASDQPANDPAQLGAPQSPETSSRDDAHDLSTVLTDGGTGPGRQFAGSTTGTPQGSEFDQQRRGAAGNPNAPTPEATGQGMGHTSSNGDEDRGYDQSGHRGGLGSSGGPEDLSERQFPDPNPFTGSSAGGGQDQPPSNQTDKLGLNTPNPTQQ